MVFPIETLLAALVSLVEQMFHLEYYKDPL